VASFHAGEFQSARGEHRLHPHLLNNLASVLLMQDKRDEARAILKKAWEFSCPHGDLTTVRILCLRIVLARLDRSTPELFVGQIKTLFLAPTLTPSEVRGPAAALARGQRYGSAPLGRKHELGFYTVNK
jgi:hypothetical protein